MKVYIVGIGPGALDHILPVARRRIEEADCLIGARRTLSSFHVLGKEEVLMDGQLDIVIPYIKRYKHKKRITVLISGDPGIYSLLERLSRALKPQEYTVIPGISTLQLAFARIGESWRDAKIVSLHGRAVNDLAGELRKNDKVFLFTDAASPPNKIAQALLKEGLDNRRAVVLERLSYPDERVIDTNLEQLARMRGFGLCSMIIEAIKRQGAKGRLYGVGIGPGDPKLITLRAKEILDAVDMIFVPKSGEDDRSHARAIVEAVITNQKVFTELPFPMTKDKSILNRYWKRAATAIAKQVRSGKVVAFVTIGDPFIYSTYIYLLKMLRRDFPDVDIESVPGISSVSAAASAMNLSLAEGDERIAVVPVNNDLDRARGALKEFDTVVLMKVGSRLSGVVSLLKELNLIEKALLVSRVGHKDEKVIRDLASLRGKKAGYLSVIIVKRRGL